MRVLLIQPPYDLLDDDERQAMPPLGLAYIAAMLEQHGHDVKILDCVVENFHRLETLPDGRRRHGVGDDEITQAVRAFVPRVVGVSCLFSAQASAAHHVCGLVKQADPSILVLMGGAHPSAAPEDVLADPNVDAAAIGEGEGTMLRVVEALEQGVFPPADPQGLALRQGEQIVSTPVESFLADLDTLPLPARHLLPMQRYFALRAPHGCVVKHHPVTNVITSRGCPAKCTFCSIHTVWGRRFRWHSSERVLAELEHLISEYGVREIQFEDDNLTMHKPRMTEICDAMIERRLNLSWTTPNGAAIWALDERLLEKMREAGCYHITVAVESGSQEVLKKIIQKPLDLKRVHPIVKTCRRLGMGVSAFFVVGFPGETKEDIEQTFEFGMNMGADHVHFFTATPYPGTTLYRQCVEQNLIKTPVDWTRLRVGRPIINTSEWSAMELAEMTRAAQARFYRRAAVRRPVRFFNTLATKFLREPGLTIRRARDVLLSPSRSVASDAPSEDSASTSSTPV